MPRQGSSVGVWSQSVLGSARTREDRRNGEMLVLDGEQVSPFGAIDGLCCSTPDAAVRAVAPRLLLLCLLFRSSWLTVESGRQIGAAGVLHRRGGRAAVAVSVGVARGVPKHQRRRARPTCSRVPQITGSDSLRSARRGPGVPAPVVTVWVVRALVDRRAWCCQNRCCRSPGVGDPWVFIQTGVSMKHYIAGSALAGCRASSAARLRTQGRFHATA
jgi:hypothetical protein